MIQVGARALSSHQCEAARLGTCSTPAATVVYALRIAGSKRLANMERGRAREERCRLGRRATPCCSAYLRNAAGPNIPEVHPATSCSNRPLSFIPVSTPSSYCTRVPAQLSDMPLRPDFVLQYEFNLTARAECCTGTMQPSVLFPYFSLLYS